MKTKEKTSVLRVIRPMTQMVYSDTDIEEITGYKAMYSYKSEGNCTISYFYAIDKKNNGKKATNNEIIEMVKKYMVDNNIIPKDSLVSMNISPSHFFGSENDEGNRPSVYYFKLNIVVR
jgi:hypothetical protein